MNFVKKIAEGKADEIVHLQFQKFSRGEFRDKAGIKAKNVKEKYTIYTGAEFSNELVRMMAEKLSSQRAKVTGAVISTNDLTGKIDFKSKKQFQGVKNYSIDKEMTGNEILKLLDEFPKTFFALSFQTDDSQLKIKPKAPMSGKPKGNSDEPKAPDFCKLVTTDKEFGRSFVFEKPDFKEAQINHTYFIEDIVVPPHLKGEKDFAKVREGALRKGKIVREGVIDGEKVKREIRFEA